MKSLNDQESHSIDLYLRLLDIEKIDKGFALFSFDSRASYRSIMFTCVFVYTYVFICAYKIEDPINIKYQRS